jgi:hypothetical protein
MLPPLRDNDNLPAALATGITAHHPLMLEESLEQRMQALPILEGDLRAQLMSLALGERDARLAALERMGELELRRTNNTVRREVELERLKAQGAYTSVEEEVWKNKKRKRNAVKEKGTGRPKARKRKVRGRRTADEEDSAQESESEEDDAEESDGEEQPPVHAEPPQMRGRGQMQAGTASNGKAAAPASSSAEQAPAADGAVAEPVSSGPKPAAVTIVDPMKAPKWAREARANLLAGGLGDNEAWKATMTLWWALETSTGFNSPVRRCFCTDDVAA